MASQALEQMLENTFVPNIAQDRMYQTIDTYTSGTTALYSSGKPLDPKFTKNTAYFPLTPDKQIGITHHSTGLGKLKYNEGGKEYGVPITDILNKPLKEWRIDKK